MWEREVAPQPRLHCAHLFCGFPSTLLEVGNFTKAFNSWPTRVKGDRQHLGPYHPTLLLVVRLYRDHLQLVRRLATGLVNDVLFHPSMGFPMQSIIGRVHATLPLPLHYTQFNLALLQYKAQSIDSSDILLSILLDNSQHWLFHTIVNVNCRLEDTISLLCIPI